MADYLLIGGLFLTIYHLLDQVPLNYAGFKAAMRMWPALLSCWLYFAVMESSKYQATFGKLLFRIKVCDYAFERISFSRALLRYVVRAGLGVSLFVMMWTISMQGFHDMLTKTLVLETKDLRAHRRNQQLARAARTPPPSPG